MAAMRAFDSLHFDNSFARLPAAFYTRQPPRGLDRPRLVSASADAAALLDLDPASFAQPEFLNYVSGNAELPGSEPLAMVYSGHQFGSYNPRLGDGRGLLLGEVVSSRGRWDLHLKGAGQTPYSRFGDGRAVLRSSIREYLCSEAMAGLGIPTTRALAVVDSITPVRRERVERGAMVLRLARSHIRFGHFEYFHYTEQPELVRTLADYVIDRHYPELNGQPDRHAQLLRQATLRTAELIAQWQAVGFAHGVLNTDNMSILGETFDYGPFAFLDAYDPGFICNHSDDMGRYAFNQQPGIGLWNLNALAHGLSTLIDVDTIRAVLGEYETRLVETYYQLLRGKLGLFEPEDEDAELIDGLLQLLRQNHSDYTLFFRRLCDFDRDEQRRQLRDSCIDPVGFDGWATRYAERLQREQRAPAERAAAMRRANPKYILRNYLAQQAIDSAEQGDYSEVNRLLALLRHPYDEQPEFERYAQEPPDWGRRLEISCSS